VREGLADSEAGRVIEDKRLTRELDVALGKADHS
jgi:predicted transcriptional regulator